MQVTLFSSGYHHFLNANQQDWLSGEFNLSKFVRLKSSRGTTSVGTACYTLAFDAAVLAREISDFLCISKTYVFPSCFEHAGRYRVVCKACARANECELRVVSAKVDVAGDWHGPRLVLEEYSRYARGREK